MLRKSHGIALALLLLLVPALAGAALQNTVEHFDRHFLDETLRVDYFHTGNATEQYVSLDQLWRQGVYAGSRTRLVDDLDLGRYYAKLYDADGQELLWSRGFDSYFGEWQTTGPAGRGVMRTYHESALAPFPQASGGLRPGGPGRRGRAAGSLPRGRSIPTTGASAATRHPPAPWWSTGPKAAPITTAWTWSSWARATPPSKWPSSRRISATSAR